MPRKRTPTALLKLRGSWHANARGDEPMPELGCPSMPEDFSGDEIEVWNRLTDTLAGMGVLATSDWGLLERYTRLYCRWRSCEKSIKTEGMTHRTEGGRNGPQVRTRPETIEASKLAAELRTIEQLFGLSPSSRSKVQTTPEPKSGGISEFRIG